MQNKDSILLEDIINIVSSKTGLRKKYVKMVLYAIADTIIDAMNSNIRVKIKNFGVFDTIEKSMRIGAKDPGTGQFIGSGAGTVRKKVVVFRPGKPLKDINE